MKVYLSSLGCRLNQAEMDALRRQSTEQGLVVVGSAAQADWAVINTCAVTHVAERKSRQAIRHLARENPLLRIAVIGCYPEVSAREASALDGVALCVGNQHKDEVVAHILRASHSLPCPTEGCAQARTIRGARTRAMIKIQDGCDNQCTYCIVTHARGPQRSVSPESVLASLRTLVAEGCQEIVLTGVHIGAYGRDLESAGSASAAEWDLAKLVRWLLAERGVPRLRLSSIEPWDVTEDLLDLWPNPHLCAHLHLPLQSGCDATLRRMARKYTADEFCQRVGSFRQRVPHGAVTTDVMVGFPGETEEEFAQSLRFVQEMRFSRLHVFRYSPRPGTAATQLPGKVPPQDASRRSQAMRAAGDVLARSFHEAMVGMVLPVLFENKSDTNWTGLSDNYVRTTVRAAEADLRNRLVPVVCTQADAKGVQGTLLNADLSAKVSAGNPPG